MKRSKVYPVLGILTGVAGIVFAIVLLTGGGSDLNGLSTGTYTSYNYYGGDAYTGIQQAVADTSRNVQALARIAKAGFQGQSGAGTAFLLLVMGLALIVFSLRAINENKARDQFEKAVLKALALNPIANLSDKHEFIKTVRNDMTDSSASMNEMANTEEV